MPDEVLVAWGGNAYGQLGVGDTSDRLKAVRLETLPSSAALSSVVCGDYHTAVLTSDGARRSSRADHSMVCLDRHASMCKPQPRLVAHAEWVEQSEPRCGSRSGSLVRALRVARPAPHEAQHVPQANGRMIGEPIRKAQCTRARAVANLTNRANTPCFQCRHVARGNPIISS